MLRKIRSKLTNGAVPVMRLLWLGALFAPALQAESTTDPANLVEQGRRIYMEGILVSGKALEGVRGDHIKLEGASAACVNCHRRSGMGSVEGDILIQPINGNYLFNPDKAQLATMDPRSGKKFNQSHAPYTEESFEKAIKSGIKNSGQKMLPLMPQFQLEKADVEALTAYLKQLSNTWSAGAGKDSIRFATVITPEVEKDRRDILLDTLHKAIMQKNSSISTPNNKKGRRHMASAAELVLGTQKEWVLDVWELQGKPETWEAQLAEKYKVQPVFALLSGVTNTTWEPVHHFCEKTHVPCWFPSVPEPVATESFYALYFNRGVDLEADALAHYLAGNDKPKRVVQIHRDDVVGTAASKRLADKLAAAGIAVEDRVVKSEDPASLSQSISGLTADDVAMFWLRRSDLAELAKATLPTLKAGYFSAELVGGEQGIPASLRNVAHMVYSYELPDKRVSNLTNFHAWIAMKKMPLVDEPLQSEAFFAVEFLTDTLAEMLDNLYQDYLIERAENMLSRSEAIKSEQQVRERKMWGKTGPITEQQGTSIYPRLGLGVNQRFASKGAYIVHFAEDGKLVADSDWLVP